MFRLTGFSLVCSWIGFLLLLITLLDANNSPDKADDIDKSKQLIVEVLNSTSIVLRWTQARTSAERACPVQRYMIRLKQEGQKQAKTWRFDGARLSVTLHDLRPATIYHVRLLSIACDNKRKSSRWIKVTTSDQTSYSGHERQAPGQPTTVRTITMSDSVIVTWFPPDDDAIVRGYIIGYGEGVPDVNWRYVNSSQRNVTLRNLKSSTQYVISVRAFNNAGKGQVVYDIVYTKEASALTPLGSLPAPSHLRSRMLSPTTALLQWTDPSLDSSQKISDERYYNVYYQVLPNGKNLSVIVKALQVTLYDLLPNKNYRFSVRTIKGVSTSPFSEPITSRTPSAAASSEGKVSKTPSAAKNKTVPPPDDYSDEYDYEAETKTGYDSFIVSRGVGNDELPQSEIKTKRANTIVHESLARTLTSPDASLTSSSDMKVSFRFMIQYRINAYVTWPEKPSSCTLIEENKMAGYLFRYKMIDDAGEYVTRNLATNFVLLENLVPNAKYKYQVKYILDRGNTSAWSQEANLDTSYNPSGSL